VYIYIKHVSLPSKKKLRKPHKWKESKNSYLPQQVFSQNRKKKIGYTKMVKKINKIKMHMCGYGIFVSWDFY
jgi:hypothetical protein